MSTASGRGDSHNDITARDLVVDYPTASGTVRALDHHRLAVAGGTCMAIMGPSGCGKSTLLALLAGLATPTSGTAMIGDTPISALPEQARVRFRRRRLSMVYQADNLLPHLTVEENVGLSLAIARGECGGADPSDVGPLLDRLGLGAHATRMPDELSGGQRQRVAIARAVIHRPTVILADEPTGSLDGDTALRVIDLLLDVHREIGATLVLVTHDPAIAAHADRVVQLVSPNQPKAVAHAG